MAKLLKRKKIFEEGETVAQPTVQAPAPTTTAPVQTQPVQTAPQAPATAQPATTTAPAPTTQQPAQTQSVQQPVQQQQPAPDPKLEERKQQVTACINNIKEVVSKNDPYALLAYNVPDAMIAMVPGFKDNPAKKTVSEKWDVFKKNPSAETFNAVIDAFTAFGNGGEQPIQQQTTQPAQPTTPATAPAPAPAATAAQTATAEAEMKAFDFSRRLNESLSQKIKFDFAMKSVRNLDI